MGIYDQIIVQIMKGIHSEFLIVIVELRFYWANLVNWFRYQYPTLQQFALLLRVTSPVSSTLRVLLAIPLLWNYLCFYPVMLHLYVVFFSVACASITWRAVEDW